MTEQHYTRDEILAKMRRSAPQLEDWRHRFDDLYRETLAPMIFWRLQCYEATQRAQLRLTYTPDIMAAVPTEAQRLARALAALRRIHKLATPGSLIHEIAAKVVNRR